ncbi:MAG TPA: amino acid ABC transporter substrate-binding protein [Streptosporangiaceae bacterium]|nr:amino acid ABC transporter substrate-binding protein [Streptosporangiaceae bacterium]
MTLTAGVAGCGLGAGGDGAAPGSAGAKGTTKPLTIGISLSQTGAFSDPGKAAKRGYELWAAVVNRRGGVLGRQVRLKIVDDASQPNQVTTNYQNLITRDDVDLVFGPFSSLLTIPASQVAARHHYAFLEPAGGGPKVFEQHLNNLFFVQPAPVVKQGEIFADYILSLPPSRRPKSAAYPSLDDPFAAPVADHVRRLFEHAGIKTVYRGTYPAQLTDLTPVASAIAQSKPDVVVGGTQPEDGYQLTRAMIQLRYAPKWLFLSNGANAPADYPQRVGRGHVNGIFSAGDWFAGSAARGSDEFVRAYKARYGGGPHEIDMTSAEAYACGQLVEQVAARTGAVDNATIVRALRSDSWPTLVGNLSWDADGAPRGSYLLAQWIDGRLTPVYPPAKALHRPVDPKLAWSR